MNFTDLIQWVIGIKGGAFIIVSWAISWALEGWDAWQMLTKKAKSMIILATAVVVGLLFTWLNTQPDIIAAIEPYMNTVIYIVMVWLSTQVAHKVNKIVYKG